MFNDTGENIRSWLLVIIAFILVVTMCMYSKSGRYNNNTDRAMERVEDSAYTATERIESVGSRVDIVRDAIERADRELTKSEESAKEVRDGVKHCKERVKRCKELNARAIEITNIVEREHCK